MALVHVSAIIYSHLQEATEYSKHTHTHTHTHTCCNGILAMYFTISSFTKLCAKAVSFSVQGVSGGIVNILGGGSMDYSE
jgi:hypothetical protein